MKFSSIYSISASLCLFLFSSCDKEFPMSEESLLAQIDSTSVNTDVTSEEPNNHNSSTPNNLPVSTAYDPNAIPTGAQGETLEFEDFERTFNPHTFYNSTKELSIWIPPNHKTLRGILYFRGLDGKALKDGDRDFQNTKIEPIQRQFAQHWGFALVRGYITGRSTSEQTDFYLASLKEFAEKTKHPEIANLPAVIFGTSRYGQFGSRLAETHPERVIAFAQVAMGPHKPGHNNTKVPGTSLIGERDNPDKVIKKFYEAREQNGLWTMAMLWNVAHACKHCRDYYWVFFDEVIKYRIPLDIPTNGKFKMNDYTPDQGWLGYSDNLLQDRDTRRNHWQGLLPEIAPYNSFKGDKSKASWLPSKDMAYIWRGFSLIQNKVGEASQAKVSFSSPTQPRRIVSGVSEFEVGQMFDFKIDIRDPKAKPNDYHLYDGSRNIGKFTFTDGDKRAVLEGISFSEPGFHFFTVVDKNGNTVSRPAGMFINP